MNKLTTGAGICLIAGALVVAAIACQSPPPPTPEPDATALLGRPANTFIQVWNSKDYDQLDAVLAADFRRPAPDQNAEGLAGIKEFMGQVHATYPDFHIEIDEAYYQENLAIIVWTVTGTNTGEGAFPPTGKSVGVQGITMLRFTENKIVEEAVFYDTATVTAQLGLSAVPHVNP